MRDGEAAGRGRVWSTVRAGEGEAAFDQGAEVSAGLCGDGREDTAGGWKAVGEGSLFRMPLKD